MRPIDGVSDSAEAAPDCAAADADAVELAAAGALVTGGDVGAAADEVGVDPHTLGFHESADAADGLGANDVVAGADVDAASVLATWENPADLSTFFPVFAASTTGDTTSPKNPWSALVSVVESWADRTTTNCILGHLGDCSAAVAGNATTDDTASTITAIIPVSFIT